MTAEIRIPLSPVRRKCALLRISKLKVALNRHSATPLPAGLAGLDEIIWL